MPNAGWPSVAGNDSDWASTERTTGRSTAVDDAEGFVKGSDLAGMDDSSGDDMGERDDLYEVRGNMSTC